MNTSFAHRASFCFIAAGLLFASVPVKLAAAGLGLEEVEQLSLQNDYLLRAIQARGRSMTELSVAVESLPDPKLKVGLANLPTDSFNFGQEPMTQAVIGVQQVFPRGQTRALKSARLDASVARSEAEAEDRALKVMLAARHEFIQVYLHREQQSIIEQSIDLFSDLADITQDYYANGRAHQQDVVQAQLELAKVRERMVRIRQQEEEARTRLAERIGADAYRELMPGWPLIAEPVTTEAGIQQLAGHPRLRAWEHEIAKSRASEDIARQAYKPGFAVDLAYGGRSGQNMDGSDRSDFLSVFVSMDVPLFTKNRQDRVLASSIEETSATELARDDVYRSMKAQVEEYSTTLKHEQERLALYREHLLPQAGFNAETAFQDYQDAVGDLTSLMRARIGELEIKLDYARLRAAEIMTRSRLLYLQGETS